MGSNFGQFSADLDRELESATRDEVVRLHKRIANEALRGVVTRTPRDEGTTVANWQVTHNSPASGVLAATDLSGEATIQAGASVIAGAQPFTVTYITNNVPWILVLERGSFSPPDPGPSEEPGREGQILVRGGYSTQSPQGMVTATFSELTILYP